MLSILKHSHSGLRWLVLVFLILSIYKALRGWMQNREFQSNDKKIHLISMTLLHVQLIIGIILYIMNIGIKVHFFDMASSISRFFTIEHLTMMTLAIVLVTVGYSRSKRMQANAHRFVFICYSIGLLLILAGIPWPFRSNLGAAWF